jgi:hypothetical protein
MTGDLAYFDRALCDFGKVLSGDKINFSLVETTWEDNFQSIKLSICQVSPRGTPRGNQGVGGNTNGLAARFRQLFCNTLMTKDQVLFLRHNDTNWKLVVLDVKSRRRSSWGVCDIRTGVSGVLATDTTKQNQEVVQPSVEVGEFLLKTLTSIQANIEATTTLIQDLEAQLGEARARLASLNRDLQTVKSLQPAPPSVSTSMAFTEVEVATPNFGVHVATPGLVGPAKVYIVQQAHRNPHMRPVIVSTTYFEHFSDAHAAFRAYNKRSYLYREEEDVDNAFNLANTNIKCLELAANFDQVLDLYTMLGEVMSSPPNQETQDTK